MLVASRCIEDVNFGLLNCAGRQLTGVPYSNRVKAWVRSADFKNDNITRFNISRFWIEFPNAALVDLRENPLNCSVLEPSIFVLSDCPDCPKNNNTATPMHPAACYDQSGNVSSFNTLNGSQLLTRMSTSVFL